jgi:hypothetical protein
VSDIERGTAPEMRGVVSEPAIESRKARSMALTPTVSARAKTPRSVSVTSIRPDIGEAELYKEALRRGEVGLTRPIRVHEEGIDFITVGRINGEIWIFANDAETTTVERVKTKKTNVLKPTWELEVMDAVRPSNLGLDPELEREIQDAWHNNRVQRRNLLIDYSPAGQGRLSYGWGDVAPVYRQRTVTPTQAIPPTSQTSRLARSNPPPSNRGTGTANRAVSTDNRGTGAASRTVSTLPVPKQTSGFLGKLVRLFGTIIRTFGLALEVTSPLQELAQGLSLAFGESPISRYIQIAKDMEGNLNRALIGARSESKEITQTLSLGVLKAALQSGSLYTDSLVPLLTQHINQYAQIQGGLSLKRREIQNLLNEVRFKTAYVEEILKSPPPEPGTSFAATAVILLDKERGYPALSSSLSRSLKFVEELIAILDQDQKDMEDMRKWCVGEAKKNP